MMKLLITQQCNLVQSSRALQSFAPQSASVQAYLQPISSSLQDIAQCTSAAQTARLQKSQAHVAVTASFLNMMHQMQQQVMVLQQSVNAALSSSSLTGIQPLLLQTTQSGTATTGSSRAAAAAAAAASSIGPRLLLLQSSQTDIGSSPTSPSTSSDSSTLQQSSETRIVPFVGNDESSQFGEFELVQTMRGVGTLESRVILQVLRECATKGTFLMTIQKEYTYDDSEVNFAPTVFEIKKSRAANEHNRNTVRTQTWDTTERLRLIGITTILESFRIKTVLKQVNEKLDELICSIVQSNSKQNPNAVLYVKSLFALSSEQAKERLLKGKYSENKHG